MAFDTEGARSVVIVGQVVELLAPSLVWYENVIGCSKRTKDAATGEWKEAAIQATLFFQPWIKAVQLVGVSPPGPQVLIYLFPTMCRLQRRILNPTATHLLGPHWMFLFSCHLWYVWLYSICCVRHSKPVLCLLQLRDGPD